MKDFYSKTFTLWDFKILLQGLENSTKANYFPQLEKSHFAPNFL